MSVRNRVFSISLWPHRLEGHPLRFSDKQTGTDGLSFYYPRMLYCRAQMLKWMFLIQHCVLSSKTVRLRVPCCARCMGQAIRKWSALCSRKPYSRFSKGARRHLCMYKRNCPTSVHRRLP